MIKMILRIIKQEKARKTSSEEQDDVITQASS